MKTISKWKLAVYVAVIFLAGAGSGVLVGHYGIHHHPAPPPRPSDIGGWIRKRIHSELTLTPAQSNKINILIDNAMSTLGDIQRDQAARMLANKSNLNAQIMRELTPEQAEKFEKSERVHVERMRKWLENTLDKK